MFLETLQALTLLDVKILLALLSVYVVYRGVKYLDRNHRYHVAMTRMRKMLGEHNVECEDLDLKYGLGVSEMRQATWVMNRRLKAANVVDSVILMFNYLACITGFNDYNDLSDLFKLERNNIIKQSATKRKSYIISVLLKVNKHYFACLQRLQKIKDDVLLENDGKTDKAPKNFFEQDAKIVNPSLYGTLERICNVFFEDVYQKFIKETNKIYPVRVEFAKIVDRRGKKHGALRRPEDNVFLCEVCGEFECPGCIKLMDVNKMVVKESCKELDECCVKDECKECEHGGCSKRCAEIEAGEKKEVKKEDHCTGCSECDNPANHEVDPQNDARVESMRKQRAKYNVERVLYTKDDFHKKSGSFTSINEGSVRCDGCNNKCSVYDRTCRVCGDDVNRINPKKDVNEKKEDKHEDANDEVECHCRAGCDICIPPSNPVEHTEPVIPRKLSKSHMDIPNLPVPEDNTKEVTTPVDVD